MPLSTDITEEIKTVSDTVYKNNLKLGNVNVTPYCGGGVVTAYLGNKPLITSSTNKNKLILSIDSHFTPYDDKTGEHVFVNGKSIRTSSSINGRPIGTSAINTTLSSHNVILLRGSVYGCWFYTLNGNVPTYERKSNNLSLNIEETPDNKLYISFNINKSVSTQNSSIVYTTSNGKKQEYKGAADELIIYENQKDITSSRNRMSCTLKLFREYDSSSGGSSYTNKTIVKVGAQTCSSDISGTGSEGTKFRIVIAWTKGSSSNTGGIGFQNNEGDIWYSSSPSSDETFSLSGSKDNGGVPNKIYITPSTWKFQDIITISW